MARLLNINQLTTSPYHSACNSLAEKFNGTLKNMLKRLCDEQPRQWDRFVNPLLFAYRELPQESTGFAPFELLFDQTVPGQMQILRQLWTKDNTLEEIKTSYQYVFELREKIEETLKIARKELEKAQRKYKVYYDSSTKRRAFSAGDKVLILLPTESNKILMRWRGPFSVVSSVGECDYRINVGCKVKI